ncbi:3-isopropylmalate dehydratase large subunit [Candidatus Poribacteria bacterium]
MGMTITEKILAVHAGREVVKPDDLIMAKLDVLLANDITAPIAIDEFRKAGAKHVFDKDKVVMVADHFVPNKDIKSAQQCKVMRDFAKEQELTNYFDVGDMGIEHALLPEQGIVLPGDAILGADSHTCTYGAVGAFSTGSGSTDFAAAMITGEAWFRIPESMKFIYYGQRQKWVGGKDFILYTIGDIGVDGALYRAMEFTGEAIADLGMDGRLTMCNMAIEAGGKSGIVVPDKTTMEYVEPRAAREFKVYDSDPDAVYADIQEYDVSKIEPQVAFPFLPENSKGISEVGEIPVDQAVIGSCTNGRISDLRIAAEVLKGERVAPYMRLIIIPGTQSVYMQALYEGLIEVFIEAGGVVSTPTCGPCLGGYMGILAEGERCISTTNRNFRGRMGHIESEVYLAGPAVAAASAVLGRIGSPEEL